MLNLIFSLWTISLTFCRFSYDLRKGDVVSCNLVDHIGTDLIVFVNTVSGSCLCIVRGPLPVPCYSSIAILNASSQALQNELTNMLHRERPLYVFYTIRQTVQTHPISISLHIGSFTQPKTALLKIHNDILAPMNAGKVTALTLLDLFAEDLMSGSALLGRHSTGLNHIWLQDARG